MKRRTLLKNTAGLGALVVLLWASSGSHMHAADRGNDKGDNDKGSDAIRVGIITQRDGPHLGIYLNSVAACKGVAQVAIADESGSEFERARRALGSAGAGEVPTYRSPAKMIDEFNPQLVIVTLPAHLSPTAIRLALEAGSHVLTEKPGCVRAEQFAALVKLARSKKRLLMLSLPSRVSPRSLRARQIIQQGFLGKLFAVDVLQVKDQARLRSPDYQKSWFAFKDKAGGGHLIWLGIHQMDQIHFLTGDRVERVTAFCRNVGGQPVEIEDAEALALQFKTGMVGTFHGGYYLQGGAMQSGLTIWGSQGWLRLSAHRHVQRSGPEGSAESFQWYSTHTKAPKGVQTENPTSKVGGYQSFVQAAVDAARGIRPAPLSGEDSLQVLKVIFAAYRASETGTVQKVHPQGNRPHGDASRADASQAGESSREMKKTVAGHKLRYLVQTPAGEKPKAGWPLLLFLHGYGECGENIEKVKKHGPPKLIAKFDSLAGCVIASPQCPRDSWWRVDALKALVEEVIEYRHDIDRRRLYVTGLSMGGYGIWSFISHYPDYFAAAIPICGGGDPFRLPANRPPVKTGIKNEFDPDGLKRARDLPVWTFHGTKDGSVPIVETRMLVGVLKDAGGRRVRFTAYAGAGHVEAWEKAYEDPDVWEWLFSQRLPESRATEGR